MITHIIYILLATLPLLKSEYIPPGPAYPCPKETEKQLLFPCICQKGTDEGLHIKCENTGLAVMSVGLGNIAGLGLPIARLEIRECKITHLFGPLLHRSTVRTLHIIDTPLKSIDEYAFAGVNRTLQEIYMTNTKISQFPKEAFRILGNLSILSIDGHLMTSLNKDIFSGSLAVGKLEKLHLINGLINDIPIEAFQNLKRLKTLDLHGNRLVTLKRSQFKGLRDTEVLDLSYNNLTKLDGSHIGELSKLGWCNASHNQLPDIPRGMFARNTIIKVIHLDNNNIKKLDTNSLKGMRFLRRLYLQDNQISEVGRSTFSSVSRIGTVDLARNLITKVDYQMFQQVKYAELINLAENKITIIEKQAFTDLYLAVVNISHNEITTIEPGAFQNCNNMTLLDLSHNHLKEIHRKAFDENTYANELKVTHNEFTDLGQIPLHNMTGIRIFNASFNRITSIPKTAFPKLYELHTVDVSHNNLSDVFNGVFQNLFSLRYLNLSHNSLEQIRPSMLGTLPTVLMLQLEHNRLQQVSRGALAKLASCRTILLGHNLLEGLFQIPISLGELDLSDNRISSIKANSWPTMNALLRLNLSHNLLADLSSDSFSGLLTLQALDLSHNLLERPPWEALNTLTSLQYLYLQHNNLTSLSKSAFGNLPTTFKVDLSYNRLTHIAERAFNGMQQLQDLSLKGNNLTRIPNGAFTGLVAMRKLDLSYNNLEKIDNKTNGLLDDCLSLENVNLSHNKFGFLTKKMFPSNPWIPYRLMEVDLSHNEIPVVTFDITHGGKKLKKLNLSWNYINDIRNNVLGNLTSLEVLDLSNNQLKDLVSRTSDSKFNLPENITEIYLNNNALEVLPAERLLEATRLKKLDVRHNLLSSFYPELVKLIRDRGLLVYFEDNRLRCDCFTRPLKHYLRRQTASAIEKQDFYKNIHCFEPPFLEDENFLTLDEDRLLCAGNVEINDKMRELGDSEYDFTSEPDVAFRDIQYSQTAISAHWYVASADDVADFYIYVRDANNTVYYGEDVSYAARSASIPVGGALRAALREEPRAGGALAVCLQPKASGGAARRWFASQCERAPPDFSSWRATLSLDKRRLAGGGLAGGLAGRPRRPASRSAAALALLGDSVLITLCIFLGVCFRRLADLDV